jgi:flagellum-specific peptidoglycan hydrolase FlgJ
MLKTGTNQYAKKYKYPKRWKQLVQILIILVIALVGAGISIAWEGNKPIKIISPLAMTAFAMEERLPAIGDLTPAQLQDWESMKLMAKRLAPLYNFPAKVIIAQMALESGRGTSKYCVQRNNCFGMGAYDSNPDSAFTFENKEQAILEYMRLIKNRYPEAYAQRENPEEMIVAIKDGGYATDPHYVAKVTKLPEWRNY